MFSFISVFRTRDSPRQYGAQIILARRENKRLLIAVNDLPYAIEFSFYPVTPQVI